MYFYMKYLYCKMFDNIYDNVLKILCLMKIKGK